MTNNINNTNNKDDKMYNGGKWGGLLICLVCFFITHFTMNALNLESVLSLSKNGYIYFGLWVGLSSGIILLTNKMK